VFLNNRKTACIMADRKFLKTALVLACLVILPVMGLLLGCYFCESGYGHRELRSRAKIEQLSAALLLYHEQNGAFPPTAYQSKPDGPVHSWRALLAPLLTAERDRREPGYNFEIEWNNSTNLQAFGDVAPAFFRFPRTEGEHTHYLAVGETDRWPMEKPLRSYLVNKGDDRFLIVEDPESTVHWLEPKF
jgi:hypothetical protein